MGKHFIERCECGVVVAQCRCPSKDKEQRVSPKPCPGMHWSTAQTPAGPVIIGSEIPPNLDELQTIRELRAEVERLEGRFAILCGKVELRRRERDEARGLVQEIAKAEMGFEDCEHGQNALEAIKQWATE